MERVGTVIDSLFRIYVVQRMYTSGPDTALSEALRENYGFSLLLPNVYSPVERSGGVLMFQNNTTVGGDLVRSVLIASRDGIVQPDAEAVLAWRDSISTSQYNPQQRTLRDSILTEPVTGTEPGRW